MFVDRNTSSYSLDEIKHSSEQRIKKCSYRDLREGLVKKVTKINFKFEKTYQIVLTGSWASSLVIDLYLDFRMRKVERSAKQKIGTLRCTTSTWTTRPSKQIISSLETKRMNELFSRAFSTPSSLYIERHLDHFHVLRKTSAHEVKKVVTLDWIQPETTAVWRGLEGFRSHKTSHKCPALWSINRGFFKFWNFQGRRRSSWRRRK